MLINLKKISRSNSKSHLLLSNRIHEKAVAGVIPHANHLNTPDLSSRSDSNPLDTSWWEGPHRKTKPRAPRHCPRRYRSHPSSRPQRAHHHQRHPRGLRPQPPPRYRCSTAPQRRQGWRAALGPAHYGDASTCRWENRIFSSGIHVLGGGD